MVRGVTKILIRVFEETGKQTQVLVLLHLTSLAPFSNLDSNANKLDTIPGPLLSSGSLRTGILTSTSHPTGQFHVPPPHFLFIELLDLFLESL